MREADLDAIDNAIARPLEYRKDLVVPWVIYD